MNLLQIEDRLFELEQEKQKLIQLKNEFVSVPQTLLGWNITKSNDYYKLFKRIDKKKVGIHHGRIWNEKKARRQIRKKEQELGYKWTKEQIAIDYIQRNEPKKGYFVGFSGGKDSIVLLDLVRKSKVRHRAFYNVTGIDPPELVQFIKKEYPSVEFLKPEISFWKGIQKNGYPTIFNRWCCRVLKEEPSNRVKLHRRLVGIRKEESSKRASRSKTDKIGKYSHYKPLFDWSEVDIWEYIDENNLLYPTLYNEGYSRLGCVVCPYLFGNQKLLERNMKRYPQYYKLFEKSIYELWENKLWWRSTKKRKDLLFEDFLKAYYRNFN